MFRIQLICVFTENKKRKRNGDDGADVVVEVGQLISTPPKIAKISQNTRSKSSKNVVAEGFKSLKSAAKEIVRKKRLNANDRVLLEGFREVFRKDIRQQTGQASALSVPLEEAIRVAAEASQQSVPLDYDDPMDVDEYSNDDGDIDLMDVDEDEEEYHLAFGQI